MKLKKFAAAALTAVMSAALLTGCSGGGGSSPSGTGWMRETITVETERGSISQADAVTEYYATNGEWVYVKTSSRGDVDEELIDPDGRCYAVNTNSNPWTAYYDGAMADDLVPSGPKKTEEGRDSMNGKTYRIVRDTLTYAHGKETRYDITTYYYDDTGLKYIKEEEVRELKKEIEGEEPARYSTYVIKKVLMDKALDEEARKKLDLQNYKQTDAEENALEDSLSK